MSRHENNERVQRAMRDARVSGSWQRVACPFCEDRGQVDKKRSLGVNMHTGRWHCMRCEEWGYLKFDGVEYEPVPDPKPSVMAPPPEFVPLGYEPGSTAETFAAAREYLTKRHCSKKLRGELEIGACAEGKWAGRVLVPIHDLDMDWIGWVGRLWVKKPKPRKDGFEPIVYRYADGMVRSAMMYNERALYEVTDEPILIVEGVFDTFPFWPNATAVLGKHSPTQVAMMQNAERPVVIVYDGDAWESGMMLAAQLRFDGKRAGHVRLPPRKDPDEVPKDWMLEEAKRSLVSDLI